jgi:coenzyme PQQ precursor peptide PqqA
MADFQAFAGGGPGFLSEFVNVAVRSASSWRHAVLIAPTQYTNHRVHRRRRPMKEWLKPEITESEAGMEVTSYLPAELDRA